MKIEKIKSNGVFIYPTTIAAAVKDANFRKDGNIPMTLGEVNQYLNGELEDLRTLILGLTNGETLQF